MGYTRRTFLNKSTQAAAGAGLLSALPWELIAKNKHLVSQNDKINVGVIGVNGMGWSNTKSMMKIPDVNLMAICDVDENVINKRVAELKEGNISVTTYGDYRKL